MKSQAKKDNPFLEYGTAFENFFRLELSLMMMFLVLTGLATLQMIVFACYNDTEHSSLFEQTTFAGLGQATQDCSRTNNFESSDTITFMLSCNSNYYIDELYSAGIYSVSRTRLSLNETIYEVEREMANCYESEEQRAENPLHECVDYDTLYSQIIDDCMNKTRCSPEIKLADVWNYDR